MTEDWRRVTMPYIVRSDYGGCVPSSEGQWCDQHSAIKQPGEPCDQMILVLNAVSEVLDDLRERVEGLQRTEVPLSDENGDWVDMMTMVLRSDVLDLIGKSDD